MDKNTTDDIISKADYIDEQFKLFLSGEYNLFVVELQNNEKVIALIENDDYNILYLPVHMIEYVQDDHNYYSVSYRFYSYHNMADECSELILSTMPAVMFAPKQELITAYFSYWDKLKNTPDFDDSTVEINNNYAVVSKIIS